MFFRPGDFRVADEFKKILGETIQAVVPVAALVIILRATLLSLPAMIMARFFIGAVMVMVGLLLFLQGVRTGLLPIGEAIGSELPKGASLGVIVLLAFVLGFVVTVAEPDVRVLAHQVDYVSGGEIGKGILIFVVALGVGISVSLAILRIVFGVHIGIVLALGYLLILTLSFFVPPHFLPVAFDSGGVTTGPVTVPFILALGIGVVSVLGGKSAITDGFGVIGITSIGPVISVMILGIIYR